MVVSASNRCSVMSSCDVPLPEVSPAPVVAVESSISSLVAPLVEPPVMFLPLPAPVTEARRSGDMLGRMTGGGDVSRTCGVEVRPGAGCRIQCFQTFFWMRICYMRKAQTK
jgi:hypothetical protein